MTKLQQAREAAQRAEQAAKEAAELVAELEKEAEPSVWVHNNSKEHWSLYASGGIFYSPAGDVGPLNSFPDRETAERVRDWLALMDRMRIAAGGYEWREGDKNCVIYQAFYSGLEICTEAHYFIKSPNTIYFSSPQSAQDFINSMTEHEKEVFKRGFPTY